MLQRSIKLIVVHLFFISGNNLFAQNCEQQTSFTLKGQGKIYPQNLVKSSNYGDNMWAKFQFSPNSAHAANLHPQSITAHIGYRLPINFYMQSVGFFCRQELKIDQRSILPVRMRLGSLEYVNWMEQKPNATFTGSNH
jgi:hypothetical protein